MTTSPNPVLTVDLAVLAPGRAYWEILLVKRGRPPFMGCWALPGGKVGDDEEPAAAGCRELAEETGVNMTEADLFPLAWYAYPTRDPRGRYVSLTYASVLPAPIMAIGGSDAAAAQWWPVAALTDPTVPEPKLELAFDHALALRDAARLAPRFAKEGLFIRSAVRADTSAIIKLHHVMVNTAGTKGRPGRWDDDLEDVRHNYLDRGGEFVVGTLGGFVLAMGALQPVADRVGEINRMGVHPRWQGHGFGALVIEHLERRAAELGFSRLVSDTTEDQRAAIALYVSRGFRVIGKGRVADLPSVFFAKDL